MEEIESMQGSNAEEAEMGQLQALHLNMNAIANHRLKMEEAAKNPSLEFCKDCEDEIPVARRIAVVGCSTCLFCQNKREQLKLA